LGVCVRSRFVKSAIAAVPLLALALAQPAVSAAEISTAAPENAMVSPIPGLKAHVNTNVARTYLYRSAYGDETVNDRFYGPCKNFYYDYIENGRYHAYELGGFISTATAGSGWCGD